MHIDEYLNRINYTGSREPCMETLQQLQLAHLLNVPFENLDIHSKTPIVLDVENIYKKVVVHKRGGFCYELNGLFIELLTAFGFKAWRISARVHRLDETYSPEYDHMAIIVHLDNDDYLADVGFGEFALGPLKLETGTIQADARGNFVLENYEDNYLRVSKIIDGSAKPEYIFRNVPRAFDEFKDMCYYQQTSPLSHFTQKKLISRPTLNGRITLTGNSLKITEGNMINEITVPDEADFNAQLWKYFSLKAPCNENSKQEILDVP